MRIAISGTHCSGKSTLVEDFLAAHGAYVHEPEPYEWLEEVYGEVVAEEPTAEDFHRQLELSVERLQGYPRGAQVVAERSPIDFLAYLLALTDLGRAGRDCEMIASAAELAATGMAHVDLLVVLPLNERDGIVAPEAEDLALREAMNERLLDLIAADEYALFGSGSPRVIEIHGTQDQRLRALEQAVIALR
ncbi:MAG TPA: AAA family ATPase [Thermoanaerobaculia bacterium]